MHLFGMNSLLDHFEVIMMGITYDPLMLLLT